MRYIDIVSRMVPSFPKGVTLTPDPDPRSAWLIQRTIERAIKLRMSRLERIKRIRAAHRRFRRLQGLPLSAQ